MKGRTRSGEKERERAEKAAKAPRTQQAQGGSQRLPRRGYQRGLRGTAETGTPVDFTGRCARLAPCVKELTFADKTIGARRTSEARRFSVEAAVVPVVPESFDGCPAQEFSRRWHRVVFSPPPALACECAAVLERPAAERRNAIRNISKIVRRSFALKAHRLPGRSICSPSSHQSCQKPEALACFTSSYVVWLVATRYVW